MSIGIISILTFICIIDRCIIFKKCNVKWGKSLIPGYNKYILGKLSNKKKIGIVNAILHPIYYIYFIFCFMLELYVIQTYNSQVVVPINSDLDSKVYVSIPDNISNLVLYSKYILLVVALLTMIFWCIMMWNFTKQQKRSPWWILLWFAIPVIPYTVFANSKTIIVDGKKYTMKRVEVDE